MENQVQATVNKLSYTLRLQVIEYLIKEDRIKCGAQPICDEQLTVMKSMINKLPCVTKRLKELFEDAHEYQNILGFSMPRPVCVHELEFCIKQRHVGYPSSQRCKNAWLPKPEDKTLRTLPAFVELAKIYKGMIATNQKILPPSVETSSDTEENQIVKLLTTHLKEN